MSIEAPQWLIDWWESVSLWDAVVWIAIVAGVIVFIRRKGWRTVKAMARGILYADRILAAVQGLPDWQKRIEEKVDGIHHETHRNDGSSIKDATVRIEEGVAGLHGRLDPVEADLATVKDAVEQLQRADEEIRAEIEQTQPKENP